MKNLLAMFSIVIFAASVHFGSGTAKADSVMDCPTTQVKSLEGTFKGVLAAVTFGGESQPLQNITEVQTITSCTSFDFDIHYSNPLTGEETRQVKFSSLWDESKGVFIMSGPVIQGQLRVIREGQFLASFETSFAGSQAHCEEMMTVTNGSQQLMRSVQCAAGDSNGASLGVRNALVTRVL